MDHELALLLEAQSGALASTTAIALGIHPRAIAVAAECGELLRVRRGAYVEAAVVARSRPETAYALKVRAVVMSRPPNNGACHHAALAIRGLPLWQVNLNRFDVVGDVTIQTSESGLMVHPRDDLPLVLVGDTLAVPVAVALTQLARTAPLSAAVVSADAALHRGLCTVDALSERIDTCSSNRVRRRLGRFLEAVDGASESVGESRTRLVLSAAGLQVASQAEIHDGTEFVARVDLLVGARVILEFDGALKYADDPTGLTLFKEKLREDRLRALGFVVVRVTWSDLANPARLLARVHAALAAAKRSA
jgi:very-short-patch-repair endonuclease